MLPHWHLKRLRKLARGPGLYNRWDTVNAYLEVRGLIACTGREVGVSRREYRITEAGRLWLGTQADRK